MGCLLRVQLALLLQLSLFLLLLHLQLLFLRLPLQDRTMPVGPSSERFLAEPGILLVHHSHRRSASMVTDRFVLLLDGDSLHLFRAFEEHLDPSGIVIVGELAAPAYLAEVPLEALVKNEWLANDIFVLRIIAVLSLKMPLQLACMLQTQWQETEFTQSVVMVPDKLAGLPAVCLAMLHLLLLIFHHLLQSLRQLF